jgi:CRISPR system Cascade subunit CasB
MQPESIEQVAGTQAPGLPDTIFQIGRSLSGLAPGALADLRREAGDSLAPRPAYFWRLAARHELIRYDEANWLRVIRIMAILTDKGDPKGKISPHAPKSAANNWRGLGAALCDGGDRAWGAGQLDPRPMLSELRFARLLAATGDMRGDLMERAARALAAKKSPGGSGVDCTELARFLLRPDDPEPGRSLARSYYARLDRGQIADLPDAAKSGDAE